MFGNFFNLFTDSSIELYFFNLCNDLILFFLYGFVVMLLKMVFYCGYKHLNQILFVPFYDILLGLWQYGLFYCVFYDCENLFNLI